MLVQIELQVLSISKKEIGIFSPANLCANMLNNFLHYVKRKRILSSAFRQSNSKIFTHSTPKRGWHQGVPYGKILFPNSSASSLSLMFQKIGNCRCCEPYLHIRIALFFSFSTCLFACYFTQIFPPHEILYCEKN